MEVKVDIEWTERFVLESLYESGQFQGFERGYIQDFHPLRIFFGTSEREREQLMAIVDSLVGEGFLAPYTSPDGRKLIGAALGITPKGFRRLQELKHPRRTWLKANWFGVAVASITAGLALASILVDILA